MISPEIMAGWQSVDLRLLLYVRTISFSSVEQIQIIIILICSTEVAMFIDRQAELELLAHMSQASVESVRRCCVSRFQRAGKPTPYRS